MKKEQKIQVEKIRQSTILLTGIILILLLLYIVIGGIITPHPHHTYTDELNHHSQTVYHKDYMELNSDEQEHIHELKQPQQEFPPVNTQRGSI